MVGLTCSSASRLAQAAAPAPAARHSWRPWRRAIAMRRAQPRPVSDGGLEVGGVMPPLSGCVIPARRDGEPDRPARQSRRSRTPSRRLPRLQRRVALREDQRVAAHRQRAAIIITTTASGRAGGRSPSAPWPAPAPAARSSLSTRDQPPRRAPHPSGAVVGQRHMPISTRHSGTTAGQRREDLVGNCRQRQARSGSRLSPPAPAAPPGG